jgi:hypothetical protein
MGIRRVFVRVNRVFDVIESYWVLSKRLKTKNYKKVYCQYQKKIPRKQTLLCDIPNKIAL